MITLILLVIIYLAFISLGLPDSILGVSWPLMSSDFAVSLDKAGLISLAVTLSTIFSSMISGHVIKRLGTGLVTLVSCTFTAGALIGFSLSPSFGWLILLALPLGLGAGSVDTALNNYVALHFKAHHMNWLHAFWGVGATAGPVIMSLFLKTGGWRMGYGTIGSIQLALALVLLLALPLWKRHEALIQTEKDPGKKEASPRVSLFKTRGLIPALMTFFFYCAAELSVGLWGSSYLVDIHGLPVQSAARWIALYYGGITLGRVISGWISFYLNNTQMIRLGCALALLAGTALTILSSPTWLMVALIALGMGLAPIFPAMIHETPRRFGKDQSQVVIGYQMAAAFTGLGVMPPLFGFLAERTSVGFFPLFLVVCLGLMVLAAERVIRVTKS